MPRTRFEPSTDWKHLRKFVGVLGGDAPAVYVRAGEGSFDRDDGDDVHIAVVFNVLGYSGHTAAIAVDQNRYHASVDTVLQEAYEELENYEIDKDPAYVKELEEEWGDDWNQILTETFDARTWTLSAKDAARALQGTRAMAYIDIYDEEGEELSGAKSPLDAMAWSPDMLVRDVGSEVDDRDLNEIADAIMVVYFGADEDYDASDEADWEDPARSFETPKATKHLSEDEAIAASTLASQIVDWANYATSYGDYGDPPWERD